MIHWVLSKLLMRFFVSAPQEWGVRWQLNISAFLEIDGVLLIDTWKEASAMAEETVEEMLRRKAEDILKSFVMA